MFFGLFANVCGGYLQKRGLYDRDPCAVCFGDVEAGALVYDYRVLTYELLKVLPAMDVLEAVGAHDDGKLLQREFFRQVSECIDGIRRLGQVELDIARAELRVVLYGEVHEVEAVVLVKQGM